MTTPLDGRGLIQALTGTCELNLHCKNLRAANFAGYPAKPPRSRLPFRVLQACFARAQHSSLPSGGRRCRCANQSAVMQNFEQPPAARPSWPRGALHMLTCGAMSAAGSQPSAVVKNRLVMAYWMPSASKPCRARSFAGSPCSMNTSGKPSCSTGKLIPATFKASETALPAPPMMAPSSTVTSASC